KFGPGPRVDRNPRIPDAAASEHFVHARHDMLALFRCDSEPAVLAGAARRNASDEGELYIPSGFRWLDRVVGRSRTGLGSVNLRGRRYYARRKRCRPHGDERTHVTPGDHAARQATI